MSESTPPLGHRNTDGTPVRANTDVPLDGRYVIGVAADAKASRDPFAMQAQAKQMRDVGEANGWNPVLLLIVVDEPHKDEATARIQAALNGGTS